jgi:hypothetical protein
MHAHALIFLSVSSSSSSPLYRTTNKIAQKPPKKEEEKEDVTEEKIGMIGSHKCIYREDKRKKNGNLSINIPEILIYSIGVK